ncbi:hypothetical protein [Burkholderia anthina]|uniref:hypothetical protein n=1 Tax=Burkholderia anthina TaxID=179879 RepID=UPI0012DAC281|nr:hypothetical protein [Burkholderia anthina]
MEERVSGVRKRFKEPLFMRIKLEHLVRRIRGLQFAQQWVAQVISDGGGVMARRVEWFMRIKPAIFGRGDARLRAWTYATQGGRGRSPYRSATQRDIIGGLPGAGLCA